MTLRTIDMHQSEARTMNLWNGTGNDSPPSNWETVGFDDSGWALSAVPNTGHGSVRRADTLGFGSTYNDTLPVGGPEPVWPDASARDQYQSALLRWHFAAPSSILDVDMIGWTAPGSQFDFIGFNTHSLVYVNGVFVDLSGGGASTSLKAHTVPGDNLLAIYVGDTHLPPPFTTEFWSTADAWLAVRVQIDGRGGGRWGQVIG